MISRKVNPQTIVVYSNVQRGEILGDKVRYWQLAEKLYCVQHECRDIYLYAVLKSVNDDDQEEEKEEEETTSGDITMCFLNTVLYYL